MGQRCAGCDREVTVAGGITDFWSMDPDHTGGITLELADQSEHFLCFSCLDALPDEATASDVAELSGDAG